MIVSLCGSLSELLVNSPSISVLSFIPELIEILDKAATDDSCLLPQDCWWSCVCCLRTEHPLPLSHRIPPVKLMNVVTTECHQIVIWCHQIAIGVTIYTMGCDVVVAVHSWVLYVISVRWRFFLIIVRWRL